MGILGLLAGAAIGTTLGILFAPRSGKETRKVIKQRAKKAKKDIAEMVDKVRSKAGAGMDAAEDAAKDVTAKAKRATETVRQN